MTWDEAFSIFGGNWLRFTSYRDHTILGEEDYRSRLKQDATRRFQSLLESGRPFMSLGPNPELLSEESLQRVAEGWVDRYLGDIRPITEASTLVLAHAVFEQAIIDLCKLGVDHVSIDFLRLKYGSRKIRFSDAEENSSLALRRSLKHDIERTLTLEERINLLVDMCSRTNASTCSDILNIYKVDVNEIVAIDLRRQGVMHRVELDASYAFTSDKDTLELAARCYCHLIANCLFNANLGFISLEIQIEGDLVPLTSVILLPPAEDL